ncbi:MAG: GreA/GreB family elongation factor [Sphingomicrobium sp.]
MSRAFVKEDSAAPEAVLERPVSAAPNRVTARGLKLIEDELARIEALLPPPPGDGSPEPADVQAQRRDARYWSQRRASAQVEDAPGSPQAAAFATRVTIRRDGVEQALDIVGEDEADPSDGRIAWTSPLARALDGAEAGETVELEAGGGVHAIEVVKVEALQEGTER